MKWEFDERVIVSNLTTHRLPYPSQKKRLFEKYGFEGTDTYKNL